MEEKITIAPAAVSALRRGKKIEAIKLVRAQSGVDLKEAKRRVEEFLRTEPSVQASYAEMHQRSGGAPWRWVTALVLTCSLSAAAGFWWGFREAWTLGMATERLPRGAAAVHYLDALHAGKTRTALVGLEFDVDNGLVWGYEVMRHPLRELWEPLWGFEVSPQLEKYATRLADYRKAHPSFMKAEAFDAAAEHQPELRGLFHEFALGARDIVAKRDFMIERYASKAGGRR